MEVSAFSATTGRYSCSSSDLGLLKNEKHTIWRHNWVAIPRNKRIGQPLQGQIGFLTPKKKSLKVLSSQQQKEVPVVESRRIDEIYDALTERLLPKAAMASNSNLKYIVGLVGPPGAGKSTLSSEVIRQVNKQWSQKAPSMASEVQPIATVLPMDGFHLYRHQLDAMENPEEAYARRGAPWTFDPARLLKCLKDLRNQGSVYAPSFDHGVGDPVEDDIFVNPQHKVVIVEGNYLFHEEGIWKEISSIFDEKWFVEIDIETSMRRVLKRHISTGKPPHVAQWRIDYNDRPNAELVNNSKKHADLVIKSVDFQS
ncbi:putative uridine kinase C227.14 [Telopea speciosissima]|uniref:putative uridine kinase C227.14 n=1 Tax=Telopea speciosissima TaxID=54955 RepID=UPI001CC68771|nr:putative uridine kinase C227.14 [Telopea speciosissima]